MHQRHVISLLIHGFLSVNARLFIAFGTAFYAIMSVDTEKTVGFVKNCWCFSSPIFHSFGIPVLKTILS